MAKLPLSLQKVIHEFSKLPGIGPKSAQRLAFYLLKKDFIDLNNLSSAVAGLKEGVTFCSRCHLMADSDPCAICSDKTRDQGLVCVVEESLDALAIDKSGQYKGVFHILGGVLNPLEGVTPEKLFIDSLLSRMSQSEDQKIHEVIIATNPSLEGETTAMHLSKIISQLNPAIKVSRIARGLPMGGDLEYADDITLLRAMEGRREF